MSIPRSQGPCIQPALVRVDRRVLRTLALVSLLVGLAVQSGTLMGIDTLRRLQVAHSLWTSAPEVAPEEVPVFGVLDAKGHVHAWYGVGQSLLFVPADVLSTAIASRLSLQPKADERFRRLIVAATVYPALAVACVCLAYWWLTLLELGVAAAASGACALLLGTSLLYWTHGGQENSLLLAATLLAVAGALHWAKSDSRHGLVASGAGVGILVLVRLPNAAFALIPVCAALAPAFLHDKRVQLQKLKTLAPWAGVVGAFLVAERAYHYWRFGEVLGTYFGKLDTYVALHPQLPLGYPWTVSFWEGFSGQVFSPERSVFLFDPLLLVLVLVAFNGWRRWDRGVKLSILALGTMLFVDAAFHARLEFWSGASAWGSRYVTVPAEMAACLGAALFVVGWRRASGISRVAGVTALVAALAIQVSSVLLDASLEESQTLLRRPHATLVVVERLGNLWSYVRASEPSDLGWSQYPGGNPHIMLFPWMTQYYSKSRPIRVLAFTVWIALIALALVGLTAALRLARKSHASLDGPR